MLNQKCFVLDGFLGFFFTCMLGMGNVADSFTQDVLSFRWKVIVKVGME